MSLMTRKPWFLRISCTVLAIPPNGWINSPCLPIDRMHPYLTIDEEAFNALHAPQRRNRSPAPLLQNNKRH